MLKRCGAIQILYIFLFISLLPNNIAISAITNANTDIKIGDYLQLGKYNGERILWRCVDIDENGPLILSDKIISLKPFDVAGSNENGSHFRDDSNDSRKDFGSSYWADSNLRSWLNSGASMRSVNWMCGNPPIQGKMSDKYVEFSNEKGFLAYDNFTLDEKSLIKEVTQKSFLCEVDEELATSGNESLRYHPYIDRWNIDDILQNYDNAYSQDVSDKMFVLDLKQ